MRTESTQVVVLVLSAVLLVNNVANLKASRLPGVVCVRFASNGTAHLTREPVSVEDEGAKLLADPTFEARLRLEAPKQVLPRLQVREIVVGDDIHALVIPELPNSACPFTGASLGAQHVGIKDDAYMSFKVTAKSFLSTFASRGS